MAELKFKCPKCGHDKFLQETKREVTDAVAARGIDDRKYELFGVRSTSMASTYGIVAFSCVKCAVLLLTCDKAADVDDLRDLADWIKANCPQDEEAAKPTGEQHDTKRVAPGS